MGYDYKAAKAAGVSDSEIADALAEKHGYAIRDARAAGVSDSESVSELLKRENVAPAPSRGPLDITNPQSALGGAAYWVARNTPEWIKYPASAVAGGLVDRLSATSAALFEPLAPAAQAVDRALKGDYATETGQPQPAQPDYPRMGSIPAQVGKVARAAVLGESPLPGIPASAASDELVRRTLGDYHAMTPEQADAISRATAGFPTGEIARAMTGTEGVSLAMQGPVANAMNAVGGAAYRGIRAATGKIPAVAQTRGVQAIKTKAVRRMLAEQAEQHLELKPLEKATQTIAKATGETFDQVDNRIREARMLAPRTGGASLAALSPEEQAIAKGYEAFSSGQVAQHTAEGLRPGVRHQHILDARARALAKIDEATAQRKFATELEAMRNPSLGGGNIETYTGGRTPASGADPLAVVQQLKQVKAEKRFAKEMSQMRVPGFGGRAPASMNTAGRKRTISPPTFGGRKPGSEAPFGGPPVAHPSQRAPIPKKLSESEWIAQDRAEIEIARASAAESKADLRRLLAKQAAAIEVGDVQEVSAGARSIAKAKNRAAIYEAKASNAIDKLNSRLERGGVSVVKGEFAREQIRTLPSKLSGDAAAFRTEEANRAAAELARKSYSGGGQPQIGGVSQVKRLQNPVLTAGEKELRFKAKLVKAGEPVIPRNKSMFESELIRGDLRAKTRASAMLYRDADLKFGTDAAKAPKGYITLNNLNVPKSAWTKAEREYQATRAVPKRVFTQLQAITGTLHESSLGEAKNLIQQASRAWKTVVLTRPGFTVRNALDNGTTAWMAGAKSEHAVTAAKAVRLANGWGGNPKEYISSLKMTLGDYVKSARRNGALSGGFVSSEVMGKLGSEASLATKGLTKWKDANAAAENYWRSLIDISKRAGGMSAEDAGQLVDDMLGKYHPAFLNRFERKVADYGVPFYNWAKQITKRSLRLAVERPGQIAKVGSFQQGVNRSEGLSAEEMAALSPSAKESGAFVRKFPDNVREVFPSSYYGATDINRMFGAGEKGTAAFGANLLSITYPHIQSLVAVHFNPRTLKPWEGVDVELPSLAAGIITNSPETAKVLGVHIRDDGKVVGPDRLNWILRQPGPQTALLSDINSPDAQAKRRARSALLGLSSFLVDSEEAKRIGESQDIKAKKEQVNTVRQSLFQRLNAGRSAARESTAVGQ